MVGDCECNNEILGWVTEGNVLASWLHLLSDWIRNAVRARKDRVWRTCQKALSAGLCISAKRPVHESAARKHLCPTFERHPQPPKCLCPQMEQYPLYTRLTRAAEQWRRISVGGATSAVCGPRASRKHTSWNCIVIHCLSYQLKELANRKYKCSCYIVLQALWNVGQFLPDCTEQHHRTQSSSSLLFLDY
jgi:hypothetical protein